MHLRRALLLFAIVLGLTALAAAATRPLDERRDRRPQNPPAAAPSAGPVREARPAARARFHAGGRPRSHRIEARRRALVTVRADAPGQVELVGLGLIATAEPLTPARFEVLTARTGRFDVLYTPAGELAGRRLGVLVVAGEASGGAGPGSGR